MAKPPRLHPDREIEPEESPLEALAGWTGFKVIMTLAAVLLAVFALVVIAYHQQRIEAIEEALRHQGIRLR